jgi:hypothetical protein
VLVPMMSATSFNVTVEMWLECGYHCCEKNPTWKDALDGRQMGTQCPILHAKQDQASPIGAIVAAAGPNISVVSFTVLPHSPALRFFGIFLLGQSMDAAPIDGCRIGTQCPILGETGPQCDAQPGVLSVQNLALVSPPGIRDASSPSSASRAVCQTSVCPFSYLCRSVCLDVGPSIRPCLPVRLVPVHLAPMSTSKLLRRPRRRWMSVHPSMSVRPPGAAAPKETLDGIKAAFAEEKKEKPKIKAVPRMAAGKKWCAEGSVDCLAQKVCLPSVCLTVGGSVARLNKK